jgi:hypothetical protein
MTSSRDSDELRCRHVGHSLCLVKRFHPTVGVRRLRRRSSPSPPERRPVDLALEARSAPAWPCWGSCSSSRHLRLVFAAIAGWKACLQPRRCPQVWYCAWPFGREHGAAPHCRSHWTVASLPQSWLCRQCRRHGLPPSSSASSPMSSTPSPSVSVFMSWWPGQRARHACLLLWCLC